MVASCGKPPNPFVLDGLIQKSELRLEPNVGIADGREAPELLVEAGADDAAASPADGFQMFAFGQERTFASSSWMELGSGASDRNMGLTDSPALQPIQPDSRAYHPEIPLFLVGEILGSKLGRNDLAVAVEQRKSALRELLLEFLLLLSQPLDVVLEG